MNTFNLQIVTPYGKVFDNAVKSVTMPGSEGEFGVLAGHSSLISLLKTGIVDIEKADGKKESVVIDWGYADVNEQSVSILADKAVAILGETEGEVANAINSAIDLVKGASEPNLATAAVVSRLEAQIKQ